MAQTVTITVLSQSLVCVGSQESDSSATDRMISLHMRSTYTFMLRSWNRGNNGQTTSSKSMSCYVRLFVVDVLSYPQLTNRTEWAGDFWSKSVLLKLEDCLDHWPQLVVSLCRKPEKWQFCNRQDVLMVDYFTSALNFYSWLGHGTEEIMQKLQSLSQKGFVMFLLKCNYF